eukprot:5579824-Lingulodinium_polyedra.AAC.1
MNRPPSNKLRSSGEHLTFDKEWWLLGAYNDEGEPLRDGALSDAVAANYWERFLLLVQFVDDSWGTP